MKVIGHRANSLRRLQRYLRWRVDGIEVDITYIEKSDSIGLMHLKKEEEELYARSDLWRKYRKIHEILRGIRVVPILEGLHSLDELLNLVDNDIVLLADVKTKGILFSLIMKLLETDPSREYLISTKYFDEVPLARKLFPEMNNLKILGSIETKVPGVKDFVDKYTLDGLSMLHTFITSSDVEELHRDEKILAAWVVNDCNIFRKLRGLNVDYIITDDPLSITHCSGT
jgi:hypothetical protein